VAELERRLAGGVRKQNGSSQAEVDRLKVQLSL
jgi:hypothetical protein